MAKRLGAEKSSSDGELKVECLKDLDNHQAAEQIAEYFSKISQDKQEILQVDETDVVKDYINWNAENPPNQLIFPLN